MSNMNKNKIHKAKVHSEECDLWIGGKCTCIATNPYYTEQYMKKLEDAGAFTELLFWEDIHDLLV